MSSFGTTLGQWALDFSHSAAAGNLVEALGPSVLSGVVAQLNANGLGAKVNSWLGRGENQPLTPDKLREALGSQQLQEIAAKLGIPADAVGDVLAKALPPAVDHAAQTGLLSGHAAAASGNAPDA